MLQDPVNLFLTTFALAFTAFVCYQWGQYHEADRAEKEKEASKISWRCDDCGVSALAPTLEYLMFVWRFHDEHTDCEHLWDV